MSVRAPERREEVSCEVYGINNEVRRFYTRGDAGTLSAYRYINITLDWTPPLRQFISNST